MRGDVLRKMEIINSQLKRTAMKILMILTDTELTPHLPPWEWEVMTTKMVTENLIT